MLLKSEHNSYTAACRKEEEYAHETQLRYDTPVAVYAGDFSCKLHTRVPFFLQSAMISKTASKDITRTYLTTLAKSLYRRTNFHTLSNKDSRLIALDNQRVNSMLTDLVCFCILIKRIASWQIIFMEKRKFVNSTH